MFLILFFDDKMRNHLNNSTNKSKFLIILAGATATGKTKMSILLAEKYGADIFSADSRQIYKEMNIGTAKPDEEDLNRANFHFVDHISIREDYSAGRYKRECRAELEKYFEFKDIAILSGGTGLYIDAVFHGLDDFPEVSVQISDFYEKLFLEKGIHTLQKILRKKDPDYAKVVDLSNHRRLTRALSVIEAGGKPYSSYLYRKNDDLDIPMVRIFLTRDRQELYDRINSRVDQMIDEGLVQEVESLYPYRHLRALDTVGYREIFEYLDGNITLEKAIELIKRNTRRYAKRQMTWYRNRKGWLEVEATDIGEVMRLVDASRKEDNV